MKSEKGFCSEEMFSICKSYHENVIEGNDAYEHDVTKRDEDGKCTVEKVSFSITEWLDYICLSFLVYIMPKVIYMFSVYDYPRDLAEEFAIDITARFFVEKDDFTKFVLNPKSEKEYSRKSFIKNYLKCRVSEYRDKITVKKEVYNPEKDCVEEIKVDKIQTCPLEDVVDEYRNIVDTIEVETEILREEEEAELHDNLRNAIKLLFSMDRTGEERLLLYMFKTIHMAFRKDNKNGGIDGDTGCLQVINGKSLYELRDDFGECIYTLSDKNIVFTNDEIDFMCESLDVRLAQVDKETSQDVGFGVMDYSVTEATNACSRTCKKMKENKYKLDSMRNSYKTWKSEMSHKSVDNNIEKETDSDSKANDNHNKGVNKNKNET